MTANEQHFHVLQFIMLQKVALSDQWIESYRMILMCLQSLDKNLFMQRSKPQQHLTQRTSNANQNPGGGVLTRNTYMGICWPMG